MDPITAQSAAKATKTFFEALKEQPLSLALVVMNFVLLGYLFYSGATLSDQRQDTVKMIIKWQQETDTLMANCVSKEVVDSIVTALQAQLQEMRRQMNGHKPPEADKK